MATLSPLSNTTTETLMKIEYAMEPVHPKNRTLKLHTWHRDYGTSAWREIEVYLWDRVLLISIAVKPSGVSAPTAG